MGEVAQKPFQDVCMQKFSAQDWEMRSVELSSLWQDKVNNPNWHPFKQAVKDGKLQVSFFHPPFMPLLYNPSVQVPLTTATYPLFFFLRYLIKMQHFIFGNFRFTLPICSLALLLSA